jgi:hypothetical protein
VDGESGRDVVSDLEGRFEIAGAVIDLKALHFAVPGMKVELVGTYGLRDRRLDLRGYIHTERAPSEMVEGRLSDWLRLLDPALRGADSGMSVPITIEGPRDKPSFRPDWSTMTDDWKERLKGLITPPNEGSHQ